MCNIFIKSKNKPSRVSEGKNAISFSFWMSCSGALDTSKDDVLKGLFLLHN
jgi:hypothetical protein